MTSRERILATCAHGEPEGVAVDFGGGFQTGIHVSMVYQLRQHLGLDAPGTPVKVVEVCQMLGEIKADLRDALGIDTEPVYGTGTMFGYPAVTFKEWQCHDGTPVLVPQDFNTDYEPNGDLLQYPEGDRSVAPSGRMPEGGHFFDSIIRQEPLDDATLDPADNCEEFGPVSEDELTHYAEAAQRATSETTRARFCTFGGLTFGDVALVPAPFLKDPKGIRDVEEWYISTALRPDYIKEVFSRQTDIAVENLARLHAAVGDDIDVIQTNGTDFGTQNGPFCSPGQYRDLYLPYQKKVNGWIHENTNWKTFMHSCGGVWPLLDCIVEGRVRHPEPGPDLGRGDGSARVEAGLRRQAGLLGRRGRYPAHAAVRHTRRGPRAGQGTDRDLGRRRRIRLLHDSQSRGELSHRERPEHVRDRCPIPLRSDDEPTL